MSADRGPVVGLISGFGREDYEADLIEGVGPGCPFIVPFGAAEEKEAEVDEEVGEDAEGEAVELPGMGGGDVDAEFREGSAAVGVHV